MYLLTEAIYMLFMDYQLNFGVYLTEKNNTPYFYILR